MIRVWGGRRRKWQGVRVENVIQSQIFEKDFLCYKGIGLDLEVSEAKESRETKGYI